MVSSHLQENNFVLPKMHRLKVKGCKMILHLNGNNGNHKKAAVFILISDKVDFKSKLVTRDKEGHYYTMTKRVNSPGRFNIYEYICTQHQSIQIHKANIDRTEGKIYSNT